VLREQAVGAAEDELVNDHPELARLARALLAVAIRRVRLPVGVRVRVRVSVRVRVRLEPVGCDLPRRIGDW